MHHLISSLTFFTFTLMFTVGPLLAPIALYLVWRKKQEKSAANKEKEAVDPSAGELAELRRLVQRMADKHPDAPAGTSPPEPLPKAATVTARKEKPLPPARRERIEPVLTTTPAIVAHREVVAIPQPEPPSRPMVRDTYPEEWALEPPPMERPTDRSIPATA